MFSGQALETFCSAKMAKPELFCAAPHFVAVQTGLRTCSADCAKTRQADVRPAAKSFLWADAVAV